MHGRARAVAEPASARSRRSRPGTGTILDDDALERRPILLASARILDPSATSTSTAIARCRRWRDPQTKRGIGAAGVPEATEVIDCKGEVMVAPGSSTCAPSLASPARACR